MQSEIEQVAAPSELVQQVLAMPDILHLIFLLSTVDANHAATYVCRVWRAVALKYFWRVVSNPQYLLNALCPLTSDHSSFKRPPSAIDWNSFKPIAEAVRYIVCSSTWPISQAIVSELLRSTCVPRPPFSRLEGFVWKMEYLPDVIETRALYSMILPRSLSRLSLHQIPTRISDTDIGYTLKQVGQDIAGFALNLTHLTITHLLMPDAGRIILVEADIEALLRCLPTLIKVQLSPCFLTRKVNQVLSSLQNLQDIGPCVAEAGGRDTFHSSDVSSALELYAVPELREPAFVSLTSLAICMPIELITALLRNTTFPAQQLMRLSARSTGSYSNSTGATESAIPNESLAHFLRAFTTRCRRATDLFLALDSPVLPPNGGEQSIDAHTLACIAGAVQLKKLVIRDSRPLLGISEDDLIHAVRGMRDLHTLWLVPDPVWSSLTSPPTPTYTMRTAEKLLRVLPQLSSLGLYFDLQHIFTLQSNDKLPRRLDEIFCGTSPCPRTVSISDVYEHVGLSGCLMPSTLSSWREFGFVSMVPEHSTVVKKITDDWLAMLLSMYESEEETTVEEIEHHAAQDA